MLDIICLIFLIFHIITALIFSLMIIKEKTMLRNEYIPFIICVPFIGTIVCIAINVMAVSGKCGSADDKISDMFSQHNSYWKILKHDEINNNIVPVEEAMIINDVKTRRHLMLDLLHNEPEKYIDILMVAKENQDAETAHYATATIAKVQRDFQLELQKFAVATTENPDDIELFEKYADVMKGYIESGLLNGHLLNMQRTEYDILLKKIISKSDNKNRGVITESVLNNISQKNFVSAEGYCKILREKWPREEDSWLLTLKTYIEAHDKKGLEKIKQEISEKYNSIRWTIDGKECVKFWVKNIQQTGDGVLKN